LQQLQVGDVTRAHVGDMSMLADILQRVTGVNDNIMGLVNSGGRKTATEVRQSTTMGVNRLKTTCELYSAMGFSQMAQRLLQQTQQLMDSDRQYRIVGDAATFSPGFVNVSPDTIAGFYDFMPVDGTLPVDRFAQANLWQMMLAQVSKVPQIAAGYDLGRIFAWVGSLAGLRNIQQFRIQPQAPEALAQQVRAGNVIPLEAAQRDLGLPPNQLQVPQIGPSA
jgi:hypothetical protein